MNIPFSFPVLIAVILGILAGSLTRLPAVAWLIACLFCCWLGVSSIIKRRRVGLIIICFFLFLGAFLTSRKHEAYQRQVLDNSIAHRKVITMTGIVTERPAESEHGYSLVIKVNETGPPGNLIRVYCPEIPEFNTYSRKILVTGRFYQVTNRPQGLPAGAELMGICGRLFVMDDPLIDLGPGLPGYFLWAEAIRSSMVQFGQRVLTPLNSSILHGMLFGERLGDDWESQQTITMLSRTGTIHLLSVSGLHVGMVVIMLNFLLALLKVPKTWRSGPLILGILAYSLMTGLQPSVIRAGIMLALLKVSEHYNIGDSAINRLCLVGLMMLLVNPYYLFQLGFQLTFIATLGIVWLFPLMQEYFPLKNRFLKSLLDALLLSIAAQILIVPILAWHFNQISWMGPLINLGLIIPSFVIVIGGSIGELTGLVWPWLGQWLLIGVGSMIDYANCFLNSVGSWPWIVCWSPRWPWPWIFGYYLGLMLLLDGLRPNQLSKKIHLNQGALWLTLLFIANFAMFTILISLDSRNYLEVDFLDVGQGDAILIRTPDRVTALVDCGPKGAGRRSIIPFLRSHGVLSLDYLVLSHGHLDHWGGLPEVAHTVSIGTLCLPEQLEAEAKAKIIKEIKGVRLKQDQLFQGKKFRFGKMVDVQVLAASESKDENDRSQVIMVNFAKNRVILTGDLGNEGEASLVKMFPHRLKAVLLKVGHHGSNHATGKPFLARVKPQLAVISVGANNKFGHPGRETLRRLQSFGIRVYRTDRDGSVKTRIYKDKVVVSFLRSE